MLVYNIFFVSIIVLLAVSSSIKQRRFFEFFLILVLSLFSGLRRGIGTDYEYYNWYYNAYPENIGHVEPLFYSIGAFVKTLGFNSPFYFFILTFITLHIVRQCIIKFKVDVGLAFIVYLGYFYLIHNFNILRHGMMTATVWLAFSYLLEGKKRNFWILTFLASLFHIGGLIAILFPLIGKKYIKPIYLISIVLLSSVLGYLVYFPGMIEFIGNSLDNQIGIRITKFFTTFYADKDKIMYGISLGTILNFLIFIIALWVRERTKESPKLNLLINSLFVGLTILLLFNSVGIFVQRWSNIFYFSIVFLLPTLWNEVKLKQNRILIYVLITILSGLYWNKILVMKEVGGAYQFIPYETIFN